MTGPQNPNAEPDDSGDFAWGKGEFDFSQVKSEHEVPMDEPDYGGEEGESLNPKQEEKSGLKWNDNWLDNDWTSVYGERDRLDEEDESTRYSALFATTLGVGKKHRNAPAGTVEPAHTLETSAIFACNGFQLLTSIQ